MNIYEIAREQFGKFDEHTSCPTCHPEEYNLESLESALVEHNLLDSFCSFIKGRKRGDRIFCIKDGKLIIDYRSECIGNNQVMEEIENFLEEILYI